MATQEFYIRSATETEARGPFNLEQLTSLADNGQVTTDTLYYEANTEQWVTVGSNAELMTALFPEKKRLKLKAQQTIKTLNTTPVDAGPITVNDMLAAADGRTADTKDKQDPQIARGISARIGLYTAIVLLVISALALILPAIDVLVTLDPAKIVQQPFALLGVIEVLLTLLLILHVIQIYPLVRFVSMLGLGLVGFVLWIQGQTTPLVAFAAGSVGLYLSTVFVNYLGVIFAAGLGLAGMLGYAFYALT